MSNEPLKIENIEFSVTSQIGRAPHWTMIRELTMNAIEAAAKAEGEKIVHWTTGLYKNVRKAVIWNTGPGMDAAELKRATDLACEVGKTLGLDDNFGVGAKVSSLPNNRLGMRMRSCKNGRVSEIIIGEDPEQKLFVRFERDLGGGKTDTVIDVTAVAQKEGRDTARDWTEVMLLGNSENQDTSVMPIASIPTTEKSFIATTLYRRFYRLPEGLKIRLDSVYHRFGGPALFTALGNRYDKFARYESVRVEDINATIHFLHDPNVGDKSGLRQSSRNALGSSTTTLCLIHKDEMYSVSTGLEWTAAAPHFGIPFGSKELCVHIELDEAEARPTQYRERLISKQTGADLVPAVYAMYVAEYMPDWVKDVVKSAFPRRMEDFSDLQKQLQDLLNKYKVKVQGRRVESNGEPSSEDAGQHAAGARGESAGGSASSGGDRLKTPRRRIHETPEGATPTALYEMYERAPTIMMLTTPEEVDEKKLRGKAAEFIQQTGVLFVNGLYEAVDRTLDDVEPEYVSQQGDPEALRTTMINAARNAMAYRVGKATVFALAKRVNQDWTEGDMNSALTKESLSIAADNYEESINQVRKAVRDAIKMAKAAA
jgi:hypothetical protein